MPTMEQVVAAFIRTRMEIEFLKKELEEKLTPLQEMQARREEWMLGELQKQGAQNMKTPAGTAYVSKKESVTVGDWDTVLAWVQENDAYEFLNRAVNKTAVLEAMGEDRTQLPPPGVNYTALRTVQVRKN